MNWIALKLAQTSVCGDLVFARMKKRTGFKPVLLLRGFGVGADLLPPAWTLFHVQNFFAQADGFWRYLDELIVGDEFDCLLEAQLPMRNQADSFVGARCAHISLLFFFRDVDVHIGVARIFADDHSFIHFLDRTNEQFAALLYIPQRKGGRVASSIGHHHAAWT